MSWEVGVLGALAFYVAFYALLSVLDWVDKRRGKKYPPDRPHDTFGV